MVIAAPADNYETAEAIKLAATANHPVYLRFGKKAMPKLLCDQPYEFGKGRVVKEGSDIAFIATGETVYPALQAAEMLAHEHNISAMVVSMHTIKPLDYELLSSTAAKCKAMITVEEHSVNGGLGEACASFLLQNNLYLPFKIMGIPDEYTVTGSQTEIFEHYGISEKGITAEAIKLLQ
jgi:transketolase